MEYEKDLHNLIRNHNDDLFSLVAQKLGLKSGDITPSQENEYDEAIKKIENIMRGWIKNNS